MKVYVAFAGCCGSNDELIKECAYAGTDMEAATEKLKKHNFETNYNNSGWLEIWEDGKLITTKDIFG